MMNLARLLFALVALCVVPLRAESPPELSPEQAKALADILAWLTLTDAGKYVEAFDACAESFTAELDRDEWAAGLSKVRLALGQVHEREIKTAFATETLPNAPAGNYLVVQFATFFTLRDREVREIVVCSKVNEASDWKVVGYYLEP